MPEEREGKAPAQPSWLRAVEVYHLKDSDGSEYRWDVTQGKQIGKQRGEIHLFAPHEHQITVEEVRARHEGLSERHALTRDLTEPLLFVPLNGAMHLIDGWHRLLKALLTGVDTLPAYLLTQEEADRILISLAPPRRSQRTVPERRRR